MKTLVCFISLLVLAVGFTFAYNPTADEEEQLTRVLELALEKDSDEISAIVNALEELVEKGLDERKLYLASYLIDILSYEEDGDEEEEEPKIAEQSIMGDSDDEIADSNYEGGRRTCGEFSTCEDAIEALEAGANELDRDGDGWPCEADLCIQ